MAIHVDIVAQLDERALAAAARRIETQITRTGHTSGQALSTAIANEALRTGFGVDQIRHQMETRLTQHARQLGAGYMRDFAMGMGGGIGQVARLTTDLSREVSLGAAAMVGGFAAVGVAVAALGKGLYDLGSQWDSISDNIAIRTGKLGTDLQNLTGVVGDVGKTTAASLGDIANIVGQLNQAFPNLDVHGGQIRQLASNLAFLNAHGQAVDIRELGMAFRAFGVDSADYVRTLDDLNRVSMATGIPINTLISTIRSGAPQFKQFGLDIAEATGLLASFSRAGIDPSVTVIGLRQALKNLHEDSRGVGPALEDVITRIKAFHDAGQEANAQALAIGTFGARNFAPFLDAIENGTLNAEDLKKALGALGPSINELKGATDDFNEEWKKLKNTFDYYVMPAAAGFFRFVNDRIRDTVVSLGWMGQAARDAWNAPFAGPNPQIPVRPPYQDFGHPPPQGAIPPPAPPGLGGATSSGITLGNTTGTWWGYQPPDTGSKASAPQVPYPPGYTGSPIEQAQHEVAQAQADLAAAQASGDPNKIIAAQNKLTDAQIKLQNAQQGKTGGAGGPQVPYPAGYGAPARPGESAEQYGREQSYLGAVHDRQQAEAQLAQVQADGKASADDLVKAQNDVINARRRENEALMRLNESTSKTSDSLEDIGVKLDADFGISRGLPGIAENIVRFVGNLMMAGPLAALGQVGKNAPEGAGGLIGMAAAGGAFGPQFAPPYGQTGGGGGGGTTTWQQQQQAWNNQMGTAGWPGAPPGYYTGGSGMTMSQYARTLPPRSGEYGLQPGSAYLRRTVFSQFPGITDIGGYRAQDPYPWHPSGRGIDIMIPNWDTPEGKAYGDQVYSWLGANASTFGINMGGTLWQKPEHYNHIHVQTAGPMPGMPIQTFDNGDVLQPGVTIAVNNTGQPETVLPPQPHLPAPPVSSGVGAGPPPGPIPPVSSGIGAGPPPGPPPVGGVAPWEGFGGGMDVGSGGLIGLAEQAAVTAAGLTPAGPAGAIAAQIAIQEINRAIKFAGQVAGIGVEGLMQTFLPSGGSQLAQNNWLTRIAGGLMGATPQLPNVAGKKTQQAPQTYGNQIPPGQLAQLTPEAVAAAAPPLPAPGQHIGSGAPPGPTIGVQIENYNVSSTEDRAGQDLARHQMNAWPVQSGSR